MKAFFYFSFFLATLSLKAQKSISQSSWQQRADYTIQVTLHDDSNYLVGNEKIVYTNNSPVALSEIYFHLYPNAYKDNSTAFARQKIEDGKYEYWNSPKSQRGFIDGMDFHADNGPVTLVMNKKNPDNAKLVLSKPLQPGTSITITTPFNVKIPYTFSRLGHVGKSYQISQWFPKIAVYDVNGWNQMPYLDQGEFYSDYGNYDVSITLPKNYLVAATGNLQNKEEEEWLQKRSGSQSYDEYEFEKEELKTLNFRESNIHDFAWFANKRWCIAMDVETLPSGKKVKMMAFDSSYAKAEKGVEYIRKTLRYFSEHVGEYPYETVKACTGALAAGAGMEYPTVTVVDGMNETEVVHEVGHNWFYGLLGSNEREYPWMDEGINTFYQTLICTEKEDNEKNARVLKLVLGSDAEAGEDALEWLLGLVLSSRRDDAPVTLNATSYSNLGYGVIIYYRTAKNFIYLKKYLGEELFDSCMKYYFNAWHNRHPLPGDIRSSFEKVTGKDMGWFFADMLGSRQDYDLKIKSAKINKQLDLRLQNKSGMPAAVPVKLSNSYEDHTYWIPPFRKDTIVKLPSDNESKIILNADDDLVELNKRNNKYVFGKTFPKAAPVKFKYLAGGNRSNYTINYALVAGHNAYNGYMLGLALYNSTLFRQRFEFSLVPLFSFRNSDLNGYGNLAYNFLPAKGFIQTWAVGVKTAKFDSRKDLIVPISWNRVQPYLQFNFRAPSQASKRKSFLRADYTMIHEEKRFNADSFPTASNGYMNLGYQFNDARAINPYWFRIWVEKNTGNAKADYLKIAVKGRYCISYDNPKKKLNIDVFAGKMMSSSSSIPPYYKFYLAAEDAYSDYKYWHVVTNRDPGNYPRQIFDDQGGMRTNLYNFAFSNLGFTLRLRSHLPFTNAIRPYFDMGSYQGMSSDFPGTSFIYASGISVVIVEDALEIHFPLAITHKYTEVSGDKRHEVIRAMRWSQSPILNSIAGNNDVGYWSMVTVLLNLEKFNPLESIRNFKNIR
jgi:hypothetical protein